MSYLFNLHADRSRGKDVAFIIRIIKSYHHPLIFKTGADGELSATKMMIVIIFFHYQRCLVKAQCSPLGLSSIQRCVQGWDWDPASANSSTSSWEGAIHITKKPWIA